MITSQKIHFIAITLDHIYINLLMAFMHKCFIACGILLVIQKHLEKGCSKSADKKLVYHIYIQKRSARAGHVVKTGNVPGGVVVKAKNPKENQRKENINK